MNTTAVGDRAQATGNFSAAFGNEAIASATNSVALGNGSVADQPNTVSVGTPGAERRITNVAPGVAPTDAANVSQLKGIETQLNNVVNQVKDVERKAYAGVAMAVALSSGRMSLSQPGEKALGVGLGTYGGNKAVSVTFQGLDQTGKFQYNLGVATNARDWTFGAGVGIRW